MAYINAPSASATKIKQALTPKLAMVLIYLINFASTTTSKFFRAAKNIKQIYSIYCGFTS